MNEYSDIEMAYDRVVENCKNFYSKGANCLILQGRYGGVSSLLNGYDVINTKTPLCENDNVSISLNYPYNLYSIIKNKEIGFEYINEGLIKTFPKEKLIEGFRKFCKNNLDGELYNLMLHDYYKGNDVNYYSKDTKVIDYVYNDDNNPNIIVFMIPYYTDKLTEKREEWGGRSFLDRIIDDLFRCGYGFSAIGKLKCKLDGISLYKLQFESKYGIESAIDENSIIDAFPKKLFHLTPYRYINKIKKYGLTPQSKSAIFNYPERVYLFSKPDIKEIIGYGVNKISQLKKFKHYDCMNDMGAFIIGVDRDKIINSSEFKNGNLIFYFDPCFVQSDNGSIDNSIAIFTYNNIPPKFIDDRCLHVMFDLDDYGNIKVESIGPSRLSMIRS